MSTRFDLSDKEWALIEPLLPSGLRGARRTDDRRILNGIFYVLRAGCPWRDLPERYGPYTTCYNRYNRWGQKGIWKAIFDRLAQKSKDSLQMIDSTIVRAHRAASGAKGGSWRKVLAAHAEAARRSSMPWSTEWGDRSHSR
jgi:transposase